MEQGLSYQRSMEITINKCEDQYILRYSEKESIIPHQYHKLSKSYKGNHLSKFVTLILNLLKAIFSSFKIIQFHPTPAGTVLYQPVMCASDMKSKSKIKLVCATVRVYSHDVDFDFEYIVLPASFHYLLRHERLSPARAPLGTF